MAAQPNISMGDHVAYCSRGRCEHWSESTFEQYEPSRCALPGGCVGHICLPGMGVDSVEGLAKKAARANRS